MGKPGWSHALKSVPLCRWLSGLAFGLCFWVAPARAGELQLEPQPSALSCLTSTKPQDKAPAYPPAALAISATAVTRVRLRFTSADRGPAVDVTFNSGDESFAQAVRAHVGNYRLPCLGGSGVPVEAVQEFQFLAPAVRWNYAPLGSADLSDLADAACLAGITNATPPNFPRKAEVDGVPGTALVRLEFLSASEAPVVKVLFDGGSRHFAAAATAAVEKYRLPCLKPEWLPVVATQDFVFSFGVADGENRPGPVFPLAKFVSAIRGVEAQKVRFDFNTMGCPFELRFKPYRPYASNKVGQVGGDDANRRDLIEWLSSVTLDIPDKLMRTAIGRVITVAVPCTVLDLT